MELSQLAFEHACPEHTLLDEMRTVVPWDLFDAELKRYIKRSTAGRPPYPLLLLFKIHLLQMCFKLSDASCEFQLRDRLSFRRFLNLGINNPIPDATTLENFRHDFHPISETTLAKLDKSFVAQGLILKEGNVVDATFIQANSRPRNNPDNNSDLDAAHGHKGFGYTATANMDLKSKLLRTVHTTSARHHDSQMVTKVLKGDEKQLFADTAYQAFRHKLKEVKTHIHYKRTRGKQGEPTPELPPNAIMPIRKQWKTLARVRLKRYYFCH